MTVNSLIGPGPPQLEPRTHSGLRSDFVNNELFDTLSRHKIRYPSHRTGLCPDTHLGRSVPPVERPGMRGQKHFDLIQDRNPVGTG